MGSWTAAARGRSGAEPEVKRPEHGGTRRAVLGVALLVLLAATGAVGYRVLAPADTLSPATRAYPAAPDKAAAQRYGALTAAPLILDGRLRVFAEKRRVWADTPVTAKVQQTPFWAYRRWPAELVGVSGAEYAGQQPVVVSIWSDGAVVALDGTRGRIAWRTKVEPSGGYQGRRTGATTVYEPAGLLTAQSTSDGRPVVIVSGPERVRAYDPWTGQSRWERPVQGGRSCHDDWTAATTYLNLDSCVKPQALDIIDAATGAPIERWRPPGAPPEADIKPWGCALGRSHCEMLSVEPGGSFRVGPDGGVVAEPYAHADNQLVSGATVVEWIPAGYARALARATGDEVWRTPIGGYVAAVDGSRVYVVNPDDTLAVLDLATGNQRERINLRSEEEGGRTWWVWHVYVRDGFVALERMGSENPRDPDGKYFFGKFPVVLLGS